MGSELRTLGNYVQCLLTYSANQKGLAAWHSFFLDELIYSAKGIGSTLGLHLVLNRYENIGTVQTLDRNFVLSISNADKVFSIEKKSYQLIPGHLHTFQVQMSQIVTTSKFDAMSLDERRCKLPDETEGWPKKVPAGTLCRSLGTAWL